MSEPYHFHGFDDLPIGWGRGKIPGSEPLQNPEGADHVGYDNTVSGLPADTVQEAIDAVAGGGIPGTTSLLRMDLTILGQTSNTPIPAGATLASILVDVDTIYDPGATLALGTAGSPNLLLAPGDISLQNALAYPLSAGMIWPGGALVATLAGNPGMGATSVLVQFALPLS